LEETQNQLEIKHELKAKLNSKLRMIVKQYEVPCDNTQDKDALSVCGLCQVNLK
jgi:hypothetical protein